MQRHMSSSSILVVDIGNTSTSLAVYRQGRLGRSTRLASHGATAAAIRRAVRRCAGATPLDGAMIASVVPSLNRTWLRGLADRVAGPVRLVSHRLELGLPVTYPRPGTIGADRLANACGGLERYGAPLIVADFGTAVTFDVVTRRDGYVGGIIAPGLPLMFSYLHEKTAQLPLIRPARVRAAVGKSTVQAMQAGALWGYRGMVREILRELMRQPALRAARVCATGGYARWIVSGMRERIVVDQDLTLFGIGRIFDLNFGSHGKRT
jgi:type III pantothenate kinase